jgi:hypothetical protein
MKSFTLSKEQAFELAKQNPEFLKILIEEAFSEKVSSSSFNLTNPVFAQAHDLAKAHHRNKIAAIKELREWSKNVREDGILDGFETTVSSVNGRKTLNLITAKILIELFI